MPCNNNSTHRLNRHREPHKTKQKSPRDHHHHSRSGSRRSGRRRSWMLESSFYRSQQRAFKRNVMHEWDNAITAAGMTSKIRSTAAAQTDRQLTALKDIVPVRCELANTFLRITILSLYRLCSTRTITVINNHVWLIINWYVWVGAAIN